VQRAPLLVQGHLLVQGPSCEQGDTFRFFLFNIVNIVLAFQVVRTICMYASRATHGTHLSLAGSSSGVVVG